MSAIASSSVGKRFVSAPSLAEVSRLMMETWPRPCWEYTPELLGAYLRRPTAGDLDLSLGVYDGETMVGFQALVPYEIHYEGQQHKMAFLSFWTARAGEQGKGVALMLLSRLSKLSREKGFTGFLTMCATGSHAAQVFETSLRRMKESFRQIRRFNMLMATPRILRRHVGCVGDPRVRPYLPAWREDCARLIGSLRDRAELCRILPPEDVDFVLGGRAHTRTWVFLDGGRARGLVNVMRHKLLDERQVVNAQLETILLGDLDPGERKAMFGAVLNDPFWDDIDAVYAPVEGYYDQEALGAFGFYQTPRFFNLYYVQQAEKPNVQEVRSFYLDMF